MRLADARHAFVSGGASGIGLAIADALAARGLRVTIADLNEVSLAAVLAQRGDAFRGVRIDVRDRAGWRRAKAEAEAAFGPVDVLVNNAGIASDGKTLADMPPESFDRVIGINLTGVFNGVSSFAADLRARGRGHIVNTASMSGMVADLPGLGSYSPSKFGVVALTETLRLEMAPHGVGVSVLCPSYVATNLMANTLRAGGELADPAASLLAAPMKPPEVGEMVVRAIEEDRLYVFTHASRREAVEQRHAAILADFVWMHGAPDSDGETGGTGSA